MSPAARRPTPLAASAGAVLLLVLAPLSACGSDGGADATSVAVTGTDDGCELSEDRLPAGPVDFEFTNEADDVNELYVIDGEGGVVSEVENVTTGTMRTLSVDLAAGDFEVRCKPGQTGEGFATPFTVAGEGGAAAAEADRTIVFDAADFTFEDLDLSTVTKGETIRFEMTNGGEQSHEFEVLLPDGEALGEIGEIAPGETGAATMTFDEAGEHTFQCILVDPATGQQHDAMGMKGTFTVG